MKSNCTDTTVLGSFLENHDNPRFPYLTSDLSLTKNAIAFTMLADGIPISKPSSFVVFERCFAKGRDADKITVYEGQEQHYAGSGTPYNREAIWVRFLHT